MRILTPVSYTHLYDLNFINAAKEASEKLGVEYTIVTNVPEGQELSLIHI